MKVRKILDTIDRKEARKRSSIRDFFDALLQGDETAWTLYAAVEGDSIFLYISPEELASSILSAPSSGLTSLFELLGHRYLRISNARDFHNNEIEALTLIKNTIEKVNNLNDKPLRKFLLRDLVAQLEKVIVHLGKVE
ncbi:MAG: hypothetical protein P8Z71_11805 [Candidatus Sulfobium sp.]